jgi:SAM-dependent methyltransferase
LVSSNSLKDFECNSLTITLPEHIDFLGFFMHPSALKNAKAFFDVYATHMSQPLVVDIGAQDVNGSLKSVAPTHVKYVGVDFVAGKGVDLILEDPYKLPFEDNSVDIILSSSCFEHSEMFWVLFLEIIRVLKPNGLFYLNVPSNGPFHRYPVDCWRFYPDSGRALVTWANRNSYHPELLESYTSKQYKDVWNDFIAVYIKDSSFKAQFPNRIQEVKFDIYNGLVSGSNDFARPKAYPQNNSPIIHFVRRCFHKLSNLF